jgi:predicted aminopeptidase
LRLSGSKQVVSKNFGLFFFPAALLFGTMLWGCDSLHYYRQAVFGQMRVLMHRKPIDSVVTDEKTPEALKKKLQAVLKMREFARKEIHLPVERQFLHYTDLKKPYAVWNVYAAPALSLIPKKWCHPVIGCTSYRGYFSEQSAEAYASLLESQGYDVSIAPASAYSTLGWFSDPVLNTYIHRSESDLAGTIFHELAHQILYVGDDTCFNESFAAAVEQEGLRLWFGSMNQEALYQEYLLRRSRHEQFIRLILDCRNRLGILYKSDASDEIKQAEKEKEFIRLKAEYGRLKESWGGYGGYDLWFGRPLNNARLIPIATYSDHVPVFNELLRTLGNDLPLFYSECKKLTHLPKLERDRLIEQIRKKIKTS